MQAEHANREMAARDPKSSKGPVSARLGGARADFVAGLGRKVSDLRVALERVKGTTTDPNARADLRRRLHALGSAAKMMKFDAMGRGIAEALATIDRADTDLAIDPVDVDAIAQIIDDLPALAWGDGHARSSRADAADSAAKKYNVLIVGSAQIAEALLDEDGSSGPASFACQSTPEAQAAYDLVRTTEPDLVVLDADLTASIELVEALMDDPLTETVPIVVIGSFLEPSEFARYVALGVARTVAKPTSKGALRAVCDETLSPSSGRENGGLVAHTILGDPTLEELGDRLAAELKEAIVGRADPSARTRRIALGQGTEVLGAVWGAIARVREVVTSRSNGEVRFSGGPEGALVPPLLCEPDVARADRSRGQRRSLAAEVQLAGRRVVVADDDPGVVWFLADLLKTAGCVVHEAFDGEQALELAYKHSPDLVISDILMPKMDGFSLCRALRRDVALRDTPVILLSWKEDLLQRVRELGANAAGYVRKESDTRAIIARVREALAARGRIEARLRDEGEVRGRLNDAVSVRTLLEIVCSTRPEARVSVRDATFLYEVEIRAGAPHRISRTDGDGGFVKGSLILAQLLGVSAGRFSVTTSASSIEAELDGNLAAQLAKPIARARAATRLLAGSVAHAISRVRLHEEALVDYLKATPERARLVARRLANGASPHELVTCGGCEPALLDDLVCDLAARGLVTAIYDANGEDMLASAVESLMNHTDARAVLAPRTATPSPTFDISFAEDALETGACESDIEEPLCVSPDPGHASSLEDAVLREVIHRSPEPAEALPPASRPIVDPQSLRLRTSPPPPACEEDYGTPPAEQILALSEATVIDDTFYGESDRPSSVQPPAALTTIATDDEDEDAIIALENASKSSLTPFTTVMSDDELAPPAPKRKRWPMLAFLFGAGLVTWAVLHFSTTSKLLGTRMLTGQAPPAPVTEIPPVDDRTPAANDKADEVFYTPVATEAAVPVGHGVIDVSAPDGTVVVVDGKERSRGPLTMPISSGNHEVRVKKPSSDERGCTIDVHSSRVAHVKF